MLSLSTASVYALFLQMVWKFLVDRAFLCPEQCLGQGSRDATHGLIPCPLIHFYVTHQFDHIILGCFLIVIPFCLVSLSSTLFGTYHHTKSCWGVIDINNLVCFCSYFPPYSTLTYRHIYMYRSTHGHKWEGCLSLFYMLGLQFRCCKSYSISCFSHLIIPDGNLSSPLV